jgi:hypothetical protein
MFSNWRISSFSGMLLAAYFIPTWTVIAFADPRPVRAAEYFGCAVH